MSLNMMMTLYVHNDHLLLTKSKYWWYQKIGNDPPSTL